MLAHFLRNLFLSLSGALNQMFVQFGLRSDSLHWGTVYDSVTKQPLDPAVIKLIHVPTGKAVGTCITNMKGHYGFIGWPGKFKILARKANYVFPSQISAADRDNVYPNLYHGEFFEVKGGTEVISFNIPMDPVKSDWNQQAKLKVVDVHPYRGYFLRSIVRLLFWFGLILAAVYEYYQPSYFALGVLMLYGLIFILAVLIPPQHLWGRIVPRHLPPEAKEVSLELCHRLIPDIVVAKTEMFEDGKFFLRAEKGGYILNIKALDADSQELYVKSFNLRVGKSGIVNREFVV